MEEAQAGIKIAWRNINNLRYADNTTLMAESEKTKEPLNEVKEESENVSLKLNIQKPKIMASGPITSCQIDGEIVETLTDFILGGSKITAVGDYSHEVKKILAPWKKSYEQRRQLIKKQRHYFVNKGPSSQSYHFSSSHVWMWELAYKEAEHRRTDAFELWCWRRSWELEQGDPTSPS